MLSNVNLADPSTTASNLGIKGNEGENQRLIFTFLAPYTDATKIPYVDTGDLSFDGTNLKHVGMNILINPKFGI
jgi:hypothetical protein